MKIEIKKLLFGFKIKFLILFGIVIVPIIAASLGCDVLQSYLIGILFTLIPMKMILNNRNRLTDKV
jgi:hypothetical protein